MTDHSTPRDRNSDSEMPNHSEFAGSYERRPHTPTGVPRYLTDAIAGERSDDGKPPRRNLRVR